MAHADMALSSAMAASVSASSRRSISMNATAGGGASDRAKTPRGCSRQGYGRMAATDAGRRDSPMGVRERYRSLQQPRRFRAQLR
jgi:hypothetical protein